MPKRTTRTSGSTIKIPDAPYQQKITIDNVIMWLYGPSKIGKTTLASQFSNPIFVLTERGGKFRKIRPLLVDGEPVVEDWGAFVSALPALKKCTAETIVVDTVDQLYQLCFDACCRDLGIEHPSEMAHGKAWNRIKLEWNSKMTELCNCGKGVIFISHSSERTYNGPTGDETKTAPSMPKTGFEVIDGLCDFIFFYHYKRISKKNKKKGTVNKVVKRVLYCKPTADISAGDRTGLFPEHVVMPSGEEAYEALEDAFNKVCTKMVKAAKDED